MKVTLNDMITQVDEVKQKIAVGHALVGFLKTRYISRDGLPPQSQIAYERSTVTEEVIHEVIAMIEDKTERASAQLDSSLKEIVNE